MRKGLLTKRLYRADLVMKIPEPKNRKTAKGFIATTRAGGQVGMSRARWLLENEYDSFTFAWPNGKELTSSELKLVRDAVKRKAYIVDEVNLEPELYESEIKAFLKIAKIVQKRTR